MVATNASGSKRPGTDDGGDVPSKRPNLGSGDGSGSDGDSESSLGSFGENDSFEGLGTTTVDALDSSDGSIEGFDLFENVANDHDWGDDDAQ